MHRVRYAKFSRSPLSRDIPRTLVEKESYRNTCNYLSLTNHETLDKKANITKGSITKDNITKDNINEPWVRRRLRNSTNLEF
jgi:hypothetical protein